MRRVISFCVLAVVFATLFGGAATAGKGKRKAARQEVTGSVALPQGTQGAAGCVYRTQRALYIAFGDAINGIFGYTFEVDQKTAEMPFKLETTSGTGVDIQFYAELGSDPTADAPANVGFETPGPGGETGTVPPGYPNAFVCLTDGANGTFSYTAGKGVK